jgi:3-methyladenine DNA glycosylase Tag
MLDEMKAALKKRGFTPDRSAIVRAALRHFGLLDTVEQEGLVRREK